MQSAAQTLKRKSVLVVVIALTLLAILGTISRSSALSKNLSAAGVQPTFANLATFPRNSSGTMPVPAPQVERNPERNAYFGETHQHTSWSFDAYIFGNHITGPADAYKYWNGETIKHPLGYDIKIDTPLDWAGVTDHSEYAGRVRLSNDPSSPAQQTAHRRRNSKSMTQPTSKEFICGWATSHDRRQTDPGAGEAGSRGHRLEGKQQDRRRVQQTR